MQERPRQWQYNVALWKSNDNDNIIGFMQKQRQWQYNWFYAKAMTMTI